jgi:hypothetical protein
MTQRTGLQWINGVNSGRALVGGVPTFILYGRFCAGNTMAFLANDFDISLEDVELALRHEIRVREGLDRETLPAPEDPGESLNGKL